MSPVEGEGARDYALLGAVARFEELRQVDRVAGPASTYTPN